MEIARLREEVYCNMGGSCEIKINWLIIIEAGRWGDGVEKAQFFYCNMSVGGFIDSFVGYLGIRVIMHLDLFKIK